MEKQLPKNWIECTLGEIAEWGSGGTPSRGISEYYNGTIPWLKTGDLNDDLITEVNEYITELGLKNSSAKLFPKNSVVIAMYGATIGKTGILGFDSTTNQACAVAIPYLNMNKFLFLLLKSEKENFIEKGKGGAQPNISQAVIKSHNFLLPPLSEQNRIVAKLDTLFAQLETIKTSMTNIPVLLKGFRQQVLTQAVTGKLTEEWRKGKELDEWKNEFLNNICNSITDGDHQAPPQVSEGVPFLVISNVSKGYFEFEKVSRFVSKEYFNSLKDTRKPKIGDILYTVTGSYGISLLVDFEKEFCFQRHIAILRPDNNKISSNFLKFSLQSDLMLSQAHNVATGTAQLTVPLGGIKRFEINLPSLEEQQEIVRRVESLFTKADAMEEQYKSLKAQIDTLPQSILYKAFKGELTKQLDSDGDARELLQQIQGLKVNLEKSKR